MGSELRVERGREKKYHESQFGDLSVNIHHHPEMVKLSKGGRYRVNFLGQGLCYWVSLLMCLRQGPALHLQSSYARLPSADTGTVQPCVWLGRLSVFTLPDTDGTAQQIRNAQQKEKAPQSKPFPFELDAGLVDAGFTDPWHVQSLGSVLCGACVNTHGCLQ